MDQPEQQKLNALCDNCGHSFKVEAPASLEDLTPTQIAYWLMNVPLIYIGMVQRKLAEYNMELHVGTGSIQSIEIDNRMDT